MKVVALAGNPNCGKTTMYNLLTGSNQYVGNWPGVTVEKKEALYKKDKNIKIVDLPGIYSLSPYTLEEVVSRDYLMSDEPDVILNVVDASNIERNLYLTTQLIETDIPVVVALNMIDIVRKRGDVIKLQKLYEGLGCKVVEVSALKSIGIDEVMSEVKAADKTKVNLIKPFSKELEEIIEKIKTLVKDLQHDPKGRWKAIKIFERDEKVLEKLNLSEDVKKSLEEIIKSYETKQDDDSESIITDERYTYISEVVSKAVVKGKDERTLSDKIDGIVTNRILALPIFAFIMYVVYYISVEVVAGPVTDVWADGWLGDDLTEMASNFLEKIGVSDWLVSLIADGIIGGVGAVLGFLPVIAVLFLLISILEDVGYMARIAFILDRIFRRFGLSGKSFIPILVGLGCSVSGITGTRTIESDNDRRMTIVCASFMPCGAKIDYIAMFAAVFAGTAWYGALWYFVGIAAVIISGVILKKTEVFSGEPAPFVMELPDYHMPTFKNIFRATWDRCKAFIFKAGTIILLSSVVIWFLSSLTPGFEFVDFENPSGAEASILAIIGHKLAFVFKPLGFGNWIAAIASILGLVAKEELVSVIGVLQGGTDKADIIQIFGTYSAILAFMVFNQLTIPCFAALGAIKEEMGSKKWFRFAIIYQLVFSYTIALMVYQFGILLQGGEFTFWTGVAIVLLVVYMYLIFRPAKKREFKKKNVFSVEKAEVK